MQVVTSPAEQSDIMKVVYATVEQVRDAVTKELNGPGKLLSCRAMQKKVPLKYSLNVLRDLVHHMILIWTLGGLQTDAPSEKKNKAKGHFTTRGIDRVHSMDRHDKLMGYQNSTFPLAVYGCVDNATCKLLWLRV